MPSKRQPSKQRRAAENRAKRSALAARTEHASQPSPVAKTSGSSGSSRSSAGSSSNGESTSRAAVAAGGGGIAGFLGLGGRGRPAAQPGARAVLLAAAFAVAGFVLVFFSPAEVDDRGDAIPPTFAGVYLAARSALTGTQVEAESASVVDAYGSTVIAIAGVPLLIGVGAFLAFRRWPASRTLTIAMLLMAAAVVFTGGFGLPFMPSLIALAVGSFQVRKTEAPTRRVRPSAADDEEPQDEDVADEYDEEFEDEDEFEDDGADLDDEPQDEPVYEDADIDDENPESDEDEGGSSSRRRGRRRQ